MDTFEAIISRRSIRHFTSEPIKKELQMKLIQSAMQAPSAHNSQAWQFVVIDDQKILREISDIHPYAEMLNHAPLAIAICGDLYLEKNVDYLALNCAAATQNILLTAHSFALGAVWLGIYPRKKRIRNLKSILELPNRMIPISLVAIGHPKNSKEREDRFHPEKIHHNRWQETFNVI